MAEAWHFPGPPRPRAGIPGRPRPAVRCAKPFGKRVIAPAAAHVGRFTGRAGPPSMASFQQPANRNSVFGFDPVLAQPEFQA